MADTSRKADRSKGPGTNPDVTSHSGGINPSAPTTGTEGWGSTSDERDNVSTHDPRGTRAGQMRGNPGDNMTAASERASEAGTTNKRPSKNSGYDQPDLSSRTSASAHSMNTNHGGTDHTFRCSDVGNSDCQWETSGRTENEVMEKIVEHSRDHHGMTDWTEAMRGRVRDSIRRRQAA